MLSRVIGASSIPQVKSAVLLIVFSIIAQPINNEAEAMEYNYQDFYIGMKAAEVRASRQMADFDIGQIDFNDVQAQVETVLKTQDAEMSPRAVQLVTEVLAVAAIARAHYKDEKFDPGTAGNLLGILSDFLNSWVHE